MSCGAVWLHRAGKQDRIRRATANLQVGDELVFHYAPELLNETPPVLKHEYLGPDFSVWRKPRGMTISGSRFCDHTSLKRCIETQHPEQPNVFIVHRLDRFTAGLILVAHNKTSAAELSGLFRHHVVHKSYHAWCEGRLDQAHEVSEPIDDKSASSKIEPVKALDEHTLAKVTIETGRKHQVRRHLAYLGHPVVGDRQYGTTAELDLQLAATHLSFALRGEEYTFDIDWKELLADLT